MSSVSTTINKSWVLNKIKKNYSSAFIIMESSTSRVDHQLADVDDASWDDFYG